MFTGNFGRLRRINLNGNKIKDEGL